MKKDKDTIEFYQSPFMAVLGMLAAVIFAILCIIQPGPNKQPLYLSIVVLPFPLMLFLFFYHMLTRPFFVLDADKIIVQKQTFHFSDIDCIFFYKTEGYQFPGQEILDIRLKRTLGILQPRHYFVLSFMSYDEIYSLEEQLFLSQKVKMIHIPRPVKAYNYPPLTSDDVDGITYTPRNLEK